MSSEQVIAEMRSLANAEGSHAVTKAQVKLWADRLSTPAAGNMKLPSRFQIGEAVMACGLHGIVEYVTFDHGQPVESPFDGETYIGAKVIYGVRTKIGLVKTISDGVSPMPQLSVVDS